METEAHTAQAESHHRNRRLKLAIGSAMLSKVPALAIQVLAFPLILNTLGESRYAAFFTLTSLLAWVSLLGMGILPALSSNLAMAHANGNGDLAKRLSLDAILLIGLLSLGFLGIGLAVSWGMDIRALVNAGPTVSDSELQSGFRVVVITTALTFFGSCIAAIRAGFLETHIVNSYAVAANVAALLLMLAVARWRPDLSGFILALYLPLALAYLIDFLIILGRKGPWVTGDHNMGAGIKHLLGPSLVIMVIQLCAFANLHGTILILSHVAGEAQTAAYGSVMRPLLILAGLFAMVVQPLLPSISSAWGRKDLDWVKKAYVRAALFVSGLSIVIFVALALAGPYLFRLWLRQDIGITASLCLASGAYFVLWMLQFLNFHILLGMGAIQRLSAIYLVETAIAIGLGTLFSLKWGATGMSAGLFCGLLVVTSWIQPFRIVRLLRTHAPA
jgi:O-antigen/teichoic acid export membrane protein